MTSAAMLLQLDHLPRSRELAFLERTFARDTAQLVVVRGRRRVGKTWLLREFAQQRPLFYYLGCSLSERMSAQAWSVQASRFFQRPELSQTPLQTWAEVLAFLEEIAPSYPAPGLQLIWDEFPSLVQGCPQLPQLLKASWDRCLKHSGLKLLLCGSNMATMDSIFFEPQGVLRTRVSGHWKVEPFRPEDLAPLRPDLSLVEMLELHSILGGLPFYLQRFSPQASLLDNIAAAILNKGQLLYEEVPCLIREELREPKVYQSILACLAQGEERLHDLVVRTGLDRAHLTGYLANLTQLGLIDREVPITEEQPEKSRKGRYHICDPFFRFWFRFVFSQLSELELGRSTQVLRQVIQPALGAYFARSLPLTLADMLRQGSLRRHLPFEPAYVGRHWSQKEEFDLVIYDMLRRKAVVAELDWSKEPCPRSRLEALQGKIQHCSALRGVQVTPALLARSGLRGTSSVPGLCLDLQA